MEFILIITSFIIVSLGDPAFNHPLGLLAAAVGYALFWGGMLQRSSRKERFFLGASWFTAVQLVKLAWLLSHPYYYIYFLWMFFSLFIGVQFGLLSLFVTKERISTVRGSLVIASIWTLIEWSRLFMFSGYSFNPVGQALVSSTYTLQMGSLAGVFGLSFFVILTNCLALRAYYLFQRGACALFLVIALSPYLYGFTQMELTKESQPNLFHAVLVQTAFPVEEGMQFCSGESFVEYVQLEWKKILGITKQHLGKETDLVVLPEFVVPFGAYSFVYPHQEVVELFLEMYGSEAVKKLPPLELPFAKQLFINGKLQWMVNNVFFAQAIANCFDADIAVGLEDVEQEEDGSYNSLSAALLIRPSRDDRPGFFSSRYAKRVLVPMGEYIPFEACKKLARRYGVMGSFTPGKDTGVFDCKGVPVGLSICYEETFGEMMRENSVRGAKLLVNITNDGWYPNSRLPKQHLEHARLRTVENGFPLIRSCNTGITTALDSHGREVKTVGDNKADFQNIADSIYVTVPLTKYRTLYATFGDGLMIGASILITLLYFRSRKS